MIVHTPLLSFGTGIFSCITIASFYVLVLYLLPSHIRALPRDDPTHIWARIFATGLTSIVAPLFILFILLTDSSSPTKLLGVSSLCSSSVSILWPLFSIVLLYSGVILNSCIDRLVDCQGSLSLWCKSLIHDMYTFFRGTDKLILFRNLVWGPITEEWVFRCCILSILLSINIPYPLSLTTIVWITLGIFGIVHIHHYFEYVRSGMAPKVAFLNITVMFLYTSLFGAISTYYYLATFNFVSIVLPHMFCNYMGLPSFKFLRDTHSSRLMRCMQGLFVLTGIGLCFYYTSVWSTEKDRFSPCTRWITS